MVSASSDTLEPQTPQFPPRPGGWFNADPDARKGDADVVLGVWEPRQDVHLAVILPLAVYHHSFRALFWGISFLPCLRIS